jgi:hypothetical protein
MVGLKVRHHEMSSSENSVSMEASNSEDEQVSDPLLVFGRCVTYIYHFTCMSSVAKIACRIYDGEITSYDFNIN